MQKEKNMNKPIIIKSFAGDIDGHRLSIFLQPPFLERPEDFDALIADNKKITGETIPDLQTRQK